MLFISGFIFPEMCQSSDIGNRFSIAVALKAKGQAEFCLLQQIGKTCLIFINFLSLIYRYGASSEEERNKVKFIYLFIQSIIQAFLDSSPPKTREFSCFDEKQRLCQTSPPHRILLHT